MSIQRQGRAILLAATMLGLLSTGTAHAKPVPTTLSIREITVPSEFTPEQIEAGFPAQGKGLAGRISSPAPACERNRLLILHWEHWFNPEPVTQPLYGFKVGRNGTWSTGPMNLFYYWDQPNVVRVSVSTPARGRCAAAESPTIKVRAIVVATPTEGAARVASPTASYPSQISVSMVPNGGGYEGRGQTVTVRIISPKRACQRRRFTLDFVSGPHTEHHVYETSAAGIWRLDIVASPGPGQLVVTAPAKRLDAEHRCQAATTTVPRNARDQ